MILSPPARVRILSVVQYNLLRLRDHCTWLNYPNFHPFVVVPGMLTKPQPTRQRPLNPRGRGHNPRGRGQDPSIVFFIPEQFTVKSHPALFEWEGEEEGRGKNEEHFSQLTPLALLGHHYYFKPFSQLTKQYYFSAKIMLK